MYGIHKHVTRLYDSMAIEHVATVTLQHNTTPIPYAGLGCAVYGFGVAEATGTYRLGNRIALLSYRIVALSSANVIHLLVG